MPSDSPATLESQVVDTADWLVAHQYSRAIAGNIIGGTLLSEILYRMRARIDNKQPAAQRQGFQGFLQFSWGLPCR